MHNRTGCTTSYSDIIEAAMIGSASFNTLQAHIDKKMPHGLSLLANYTWSKSFDDMPQATRVSNTEDLNPGESYVYPIYPSNATNIPAAAIVARHQGTRPRHLGHRPSKRTLDLLRLRTCPSCTMGIFLFARYSTVGVPADSSSTTPEIR